MALARKHPSLRGQSQLQQWRFRLKTPVTLGMFYESFRVGLTLVDAIAPHIAEVYISATDFARIRTRSYMLLAFEGTTVAAKWDDVDCSW